MSDASASWVQFPSSSRASVRKVGRRRSFYAEGFVCFQFLCQILLLFEALGPSRIIIRTVATLSSIFLIVMRKAGRGAAHPAANTAVWIFFILGLGFLHPNTNSVMSGLMDLALYASILAPLLWVPLLNASSKTLKNVIYLSWLFSVASASAGILQVQYPGRFQPNLSTAIQAQGTSYVNSLTITTASGAQVFRPMGLTDSPGGAGIGAFYGAILGIGLFLTSRRIMPKVVFLVSICISVACLYLCQVRSLVVAFVICLILLIGMFFWHGRGERLIGTVAILSVVMGLSFWAAFLLAPRAVVDRLNSLTTGSASETYYNNRGGFLQDTFEEILPKYPLGAGLGRWGTPSIYFGDTRDPGKIPIYVEIQWTAWILDGGIGLTLLYLLAIGQSFSYCWHATHSRLGQSLWTWTVLILAVNLGTFALTFNSPVFLGPLGLQFWLLNALLASVLGIRKPSRKLAISLR